MARRMKTVAAMAGLAAAILLFVHDDRCLGDRIDRTGPLRKVSKTLILQVSMWMEYQNAAGEGIVEVAPDARSLVYAYKGNEKGERVVSLNGKEYGPYGYVGAMKLSPDAKKLAFVIAKKAFERRHVAINGKEGKPYDLIDEASLHFSPDSKRLAYSVYDKGKQKVSMVIDGKPEGKYSSIDTGSFIFSPDSKRYAYRCQDDGYWRIVVDGKPRRDRVYWGGFVRGLLGSGEASQPVFSPDGRHIAYNVSFSAFSTSALTQRSKAFSFVDGKKLGGRFCGFTPNGKAAYIDYDKEKGTQRLVVDGLLKKKGNAFRGSIQSITFSPDSKHIAYVVADTAENSFVVVDGEAGKNYQKIMEDSITFSPDSKRVAYVASENGKLFLVLDRRERKEFVYYWWSPILSRPLFSPDSKRIAYVAVEPVTNEYFVVLDGLAGKRYRSIKSPAFSPDSAHLAYVAEGDGTFVVANGTEGQEKDVYSEVVFDAPDKLHYLTRTGKSIFLIEETIR
jgi:Tol biopolymer transport system component